jgi:hypothetical protein
VTGSVIEFSNSQGGNQCCNERHGFVAALERGTDSFRARYVQDVVVPIFLFGKTLLLNYIDLRFGHWFSGL